MPRPSLAICLDDLKLEIKDAMQRARTLGFSAIDVSATSGPISPVELSLTGQRHLMKHLADLGLRLGSLRGPAGGPSYIDPAGGEQRLNSALKIIDLAGRLRVAIVSTTLGQVSGLTDRAPSDRLREALSLLADRADRAGVTLTIETASFPVIQLSPLLAEINCPVLAACCDTGAMLMSGEDPHAVADVLAGRIRHVRCRDAVGGSPAQPGHEVPLGQGTLDLPRFLATLDEAAFAGDIVLTRTTSSNPSADLLHAREAIENFLP